MPSVILAAVCLGLIGAALFFLIRSNELSTQLRQATEAWQVKEDSYISELAKLEKIKHIPDIIEKARRTKADVEAKLADAEKRADGILQRALADAQDRCRKLQTEAEKLQTDAQELKADAQEVLRVAKTQAQHIVGAAQIEAKELVAKTRKDTKDKREKTEAVLVQATNYALEIRQKAERRAEEIAGEAYQAKGKVRDYEALAQALKNKIENYQGVYLIPTAHVLDELAQEYLFNTAGVRLKLARERTKLMLEQGTAATCGYPDGWKKDHALKFVLSTFNGKVDTILSRLKAGNQGRLIQEIKDAYAQINSDGEVYKNARIREEFLDARLEELKWGVAVYRLKERAREEQRAIKEQMREEQRAKKEIEKAIRQAEREEELVNKAIARIRKQFEESSGAERAKYESQLADLSVKLAEAEEKGKKALSMAQQTKRGHVYVISNVGSFGDNVYKVGLTRRLDPNERVRELGDASVPFPFDVHAMLRSEDAPALETALHHRFAEKQINKINKRKEFFRVSLAELKEVVDELGIESTWTMESEASQYRETMALEAAMRANADVRKKWLAEQATFSFEEDDFDDAEQELEEAEA